MLGQSAFTKELKDFNKEHLSAPNVAVKDDNTTVKDEKTDNFLSLASSVFAMLLENIGSPTHTKAYHNAFTVAYNAQVYKYLAKP